MMDAVTIFEHPDFKGQSQVLTPGRYDNDLGQLSIGNDSLSSLKVSQGLVVRLYEHWHFQGRYLDVAMDTPVLPRFWNDRTSSLIVYAATDEPPVTDVVEVYEHGSYQGKSQTSKVGRYDSADGTLELNDSISSVLLPPGLLLRLYENPGFTGAFVDLAGDVEALGSDWNDRASSMEVLNAPPERTFPENEIDVLHDYLPEELHNLMGGYERGSRPRICRPKTNLRGPMPFWSSRSSRPGVSCSGS
jgi:Beta/Gamma crystallin